MFGFSRRKKKEGKVFSSDYTFTISVANPDKLNDDEYIAATMERYATELGTDILLCCEHTDTDTSNSEYRRNAVGNLYSQGGVFVRVFHDGIISGSTHGPNVPPRNLRRFLYMVDHDFDIAELNIQNNRLRRSQMYSEQNRAA